MGLRDAVRRLTKPPEDLDRERLAEWCSHVGAVPIDEVVPRQRARVAGEVTAVRVVPRAGSPALEVTVDDGRRRITAVFLGRRRIGGMTNGRRLIIEGMAAREGRVLAIVNPEYELLPPAR